MLASELSSGLRVASLQDGPVAVALSTLLGSSIAKDDSLFRLLPTNLRGCRLPIRRWVRL